MEQREGLYKWRVVCAGKHDGPEHVFERVNEGAAVSTLIYFSKAEMEFTQEFCLPAHMEKRFVGKWEEVEYEIG